MTQIHNLHDRISLTIEDHIATVCFNRPEKMNALDMPMFAALLEAQQAIADDSTVRAVVLTATGEHFCAGLDVQGVMTDPSAIETLLSKGEPEQQWLGNYVQQVVVGWQQLKVPVIAALQGYVFGGGFQLALGADFRITHPESQLSVMEIRWGIIPDMGITMVGCSVAALDQLKLLAMTGKRISGREAQQLGLSTQLAEDPVTVALELARSIVANNPDAVKAVKHLFNQYDGDNKASLAREEALQRTLLFSANQLEAVQANIQKRAPVFS